MNGDGYDDLIIGAYRAGSTSGRTYVVYGGAIIGAKRAGHRGRTGGRLSALDGRCERRRLSPGSSGPMIMRGDLCGLSGRQGRKAQCRSRRRARPAPTTSSAMRARTALPASPLAMWCAAGRAMTVSASPAYIDGGTGRDVLAGRIKPVPRPRDVGNVAINVSVDSVEG